MNERLVPNPAPTISIVVEDPGAANMVIGVRDTLVALGATAKVFAGPDAISQMRSYGDSCAAPLNGIGPILGAHPDLVVFGTSEREDSIVRAIVAAARAQGTHMLGLVDMPVNAERRFEANGLPLGAAPDDIAAPDLATLSRFRALGFQGARLHLVVHPLNDAVALHRDRLSMLDRLEARARLFPGLTQGQKVVLFAAESGDRLNPTASCRTPDYKLFGRGGRRSRASIVLEEVIDACRGLTESVYFAVRLAPKNTRDDFGSLLDEADCVSQGGNPAELLWASDLVVGMTSMILCEARLLGQSVLSVLPRLVERDWLAEIADGRIEAVFDRGALAARIGALVRDPTPIVAEPPPKDRKRVATLISEMAVAAMERRLAFKSNV
jgi:hypothetical protein